MKVVGVLLTFNNGDTIRQFTSYVKARFDALAVPDPAAFSIWLPPAKMLIGIAEFLDASGVIVRCYDLRALLGLAMLLIKQIGGFQANTGNNVPCITPGLTLQHNALLPASDGETLLLIVMARATGHILPLTAPFHAIEIAQYFLNVRCRHHPSICS